MGSGLIIGKKLVRSMIVLADPDISKYFHIFVFVYDCKVNKLFKFVETWFLQLY